MILVLISSHIPGNDGLHVAASHDGFFLEQCQAFWDCLYVKISITL